MPSIKVWKQEALLFFSIDSHYTWFMVLIRKVWRCIRFDSSANCSSFVLCFIWLCWYGTSFSSTLSILLILPFFYALYLYKLYKMISGDLYCYMQLLLVSDFSNSATWTVSGLNSYWGSLSSWESQYHNISENIITHNRRMDMFTAILDGWELSQP